MWENWVCDNSTHIHTQHEGALCLWPTHWCRLGDEQPRAYGKQKKQEVSTPRGTEWALPASGWGWCRRWSQKSKVKGGSDSMHKQTTEWRGDEQKHPLRPDGQGTDIIPKEGEEGRGEDVWQEREKLIRDAIIINGLPSLFFFFLLNTS